MVSQHTHTHLFDIVNSIVDTQNHTSYVILTYKVMNENATNTHTIARAASYAQTPHILDYAVPFNSTGVYLIPLGIK